MTRQYVTAFPGRRDSYQVPLALHEHERLACFVTDGYDAGWVARGLKSLGVRRLGARQCAALPDGKVRPGFDLELGARLLRRVVAPSKGAVLADEWLARRGAAAANAAGASALFYEFQAEIGFQLLASRQQRRVLFHFHPHPDWEHPLLQREIDAYPEFAGLIRANTRAGMAGRYAEYTRAAWRFADHVIVASNCTRRSLLAAGCPPHRITVVPYGREAVEAASAPASPLPVAARPFALWVGSGSVRKGLHHVCRAWQASGGAAHGELLVVARTVDPGMERWLQVPGVRWIRGLSRAELNAHYDAARVFVMPSIAEGFGQVYLEALAHGCPVIGTRHSVLPDVEDAQRWVRYVEVGDVAALAAEFAGVFGQPAPSPDERALIAASVRGYTWERFRAGIEAVLRRFD